jgi:phosphatidyl-myo-inositol dimannoside synthase
VIRILYVSHSFPLPGEPLSNVGGMQRVAVELHAALAAHPQVRLSRRVLETSWKWTGVRTGPFLAGLLANLTHRVRRERIDVVLFSSMVTASVVAVLGPGLRAAGAITAAIPVGRDVTLPNPVYQRLVPRIFAGLDRVFPISRATGAECLARGLAPERMRVVPCGVDLVRFAGGPSRAEARRALLAELAAAGPRPPENARLLFSVGRHQERKGFHWFVERVMPLLPTEYLYLLGGEGPMTGAVRDQVAAAGLDGRVRLLGRLSEERLVACYRASDLFVMPNIPVPGDIEGFGVVMLEAGASGAPVVAAELEGIRDVIEAGRNGVLVESGDARGFADAILRLAGDPERLQAASRAASAHTAERFGWSTIADTLVEMLSEARRGL